MVLDLTGRGGLTVVQQKRLDAIATEMRGPYVDLINRLAIGHEHEIDWWVSEIASRNTNTNSLFVNCCRAVFFREWVKNDSNPVEVMTGSPPLGSVFRHYCRSSGLKIRLTCTMNWFGRAGKLMKEVLPYLKFHFLLCCQYLVCRWIVRATARDLPADLTLIDVFVDEHSFKGGVFQDRYFGDFGGHVNTTERQRFMYIPTYSGGLWRMISVFRAMRHSPKNFLLMQDFLKWKDYLYAFLYPFRALKFFPRDMMLDGLDVTPLIRSTWGAHLFSGGSILGLLNFRFAQRLKERGVSLRLVVDWFENQSIDKGANAGFRRFFPATPLIGYQGFIVPKHYLCMYPTQQEADNGVLPHVMAVCGRGFLEERKEFFPGFHVRTAPAFRFAGVWSERRHRPDPNFFTVLVALPLEESWVDVFRVSAAASREALPPNTRFWLKSHPASGPVERLIRKAGVRFPPAFELVQDEFAELVEKVDVVMSNNSSAGVEALARGIPVIVIASQGGITQNPIPDSVKPDLWRLCYSPQEVANGLNAFFREPRGLGSRYDTLAREVRETFFEPVTRETVRAFLQLDVDSQV